MRRLIVSLSLAVVALLGFTTSEFSTRAQDATPDSTVMMDMASHPLVGAWYVIVPDGGLGNIFAADGTLTFAVAPNYVDPMLGLTFQGPFVGAWEPTSERGARFTAIQALTDAEGTYVGTFTIEGHPLVSEDGQTLTDNTPDARIIVRDATNAILVDEIITLGVTAYRITPGSLILPEGTPVAATPAP